jgi:DNA primase
MPTTREEAVSEVKRRLDIVEFISQYLPLKKAGINFSGRCPFHDEKTPSFMVSAERQTFKCFGCGKGGDILTFVIEKEGLSFPEAIEMLAAKAGVELPTTQSSATPEQRSGKKRLLELNESCQNYWHELLLRHPKASHARQYVSDRGLTPTLIEQFKIGFAPPADATRQLLTKKGFSGAEERLAGEPARFAGRLTFPITDVTGQVIGFTGRQLPVPAGIEASGPKYWNTPETPVFHKSDALYALHLAKDAIRQTETVILAEGQMDVIGLHAAGLTQSVASSGTALTERQCQMLARFTTEIVFCYDADAAGLKAAERGFEVALAADLNPTVMSLPAGKDPGDLGFSKPEQLKRAFEQRQPVIAWLLSRAAEEYGLAQPVAKKKIVKRLAPWLNRVKDAVERRAWLDVIAERLQTTTEAINDTLKSNLARPVQAATPPTNQAIKITDTQLIVGLLVAHPALLQEQSLSQLQLALPPEWHFALDWLLATTENRPTLPRENQLQLDECALLASKQYEDLTPEERRIELNSLLSRRSANVRRQLTTALIQAQGSGDQAEIDRLHQLLQSVKVNASD